ncbi:hypothetical protein T484DRAFT_1937722 [Baffinella frigidus]|nr:hypothetical protein T484DRAFT_1937722 [Cryptophyta sp. CCMP2293]
MVLTAGCCAVLCVPPPPGWWRLLQVAYPDLVLFWWLAVPCTGLDHVARMARAFEECLLLRGSRTCVLDKREEARQRRHLRGIQLGTYPHLRVTTRILAVCVCPKIAYPPVSSALEALQSPQISSCSEMRLVGLALAVLLVPARATRG